MCWHRFLQLFELQFILFFFVVLTKITFERSNIYAKLAHFFLSRPICDFVTWKFQSNRLVRSKIFRQPDKKHAMACKVCKNWAFQRNLLSSAHTKNSQKGVICNLIFRRCSLYPKINANQHFRSTPSQNLFYIFGGSRRSTVC